MPVSVGIRRQPAGRPSDDTTHRRSQQSEEGSRPEHTHAAVPQTGGPAPRASHVPSSRTEGSGAVALPNPQLEPDAAACAELRALLPTLATTELDKETSRRLQILIDHAGKAERQLVFNEFFPKALVLMQHVFGNYAIQRVLHYGTPEQLAALRPIVADNLLELSRNTFGCRVAQKALEVYRDSPLQGLLCGHVVALAEDQNGNHVLQRCMELYPDSVHFISRELQGSVISTSCQKYGCRVIQRLVTAVASNPAYHSVLLATIDEVVSNLQHLATDQFGNYVVQALMTCRQEAGLKLIYLLRGAYPILCRHKNASNVVETAFQVSPPSLRNALITELLPFIVQLSGDPFGNFVVQKLYDLTDAANQAQLSAAIRSGSSVLKMNIYGRSVLGMLARKEGAGAPNVQSQTQVHAAAPQQQPQQQQQQQQ
eukprot:Rhum_TRINITY_DN15295_c8_g1::Rhum_TRINITY_DN15295_c8_g1_i1::g.149393::m.149393/K17943/PUM; pumilio RNA-binding family